MSSRLLAARVPQGFAADHRFSARDTAALPEPEAGPEPEPEPDPIAEAFRQGLEAGEAEARAFFIEQVGELEARFAGLDRGFAEIADAEGDRVRARLTEVVAALCEATLQPLTLDRDALAARVERAAAMLQRANDERRVRLNPLDLELVQPLLKSSLILEADPALMRGALRIETADGGIEDGPESWAAVIREALGQC